MTAKQYLAALKKLGLTPFGKDTVQLLGLSVRQLARISAGDSAVPEPVAKLLRLMIREGISPADVD